MKITYKNLNFCKQSNICTLTYTSSIIKNNFKTKIILNFNCNLNNTLKCYLINNFRFKVL